MNELERMKQIAGINKQLNEGKVFNDTSEMLQSLLKDIQDIQISAEEGIFDISDIARDLQMVIQYYKDAQVR